MDDRVKIFLARCGVTDIDSFSEKCSQLKDFLYEENSKYNLTRIRDEFEYWNRHIADSASIGIYFKKQLTAAKKIADIGCGAGFPSIILAIMFPNQIFTAIDSIGKKTNFVRIAAQKLELKNLQVITGRSNELKLSTKSDLIIARAVAEPVKIFKETKHLLAQSGNYILYQTPTQIDPLKTDIEKISAKNGFKWHLSEPFQLPGGENRIFLYSTRN